MQGKYGEPWFLGDRQLDYQEWGFDGTIWACPTESEIAEAKHLGGSVEPYCVAERVDRVMAEHIIACVNFCQGIPTESLSPGLVAETVQLLKDFEQWQGDLVLSNEAWKGGMAEFPTLTADLFDRLLKLQEKRNEILAKWKGE